MTEKPFMKFCFLLLLLLLSSFATAQTGQSGGQPGPSNDNHPELSKAELIAVQINMSSMLNRVKSRWVECTYMNQPAITSFYDLYKSLLNVQIVDSLRSEQFIPGPKKIEFKDCRPPLADPPPGNKMNCLFQAAEIHFITYVLNNASAYQILDDVGFVPEDEFKQVHSYFLDIVENAPKPATSK